MGLMGLRGLMNERDILAIGPGHEAEVARMVQMLQDPANSANSANSASSISIGEMKLPFLVQAEGNVGFVEIRGIMSRRVPMWAAGWYHGTEWTIEGLDFLMSRPEIDTVVLGIHSPGGLVTGTAELASKIREVSASGRRVIAWVDWLGASAAYWVAAAADRVWMLPSGRVGSIGAVIALYDYAKAFEKAGVTLEGFTSDADGKLRGALGRAMTEEDRAYFQASVDKAGARFREAVTARRGALPAEAFSGDTWDGEDALRLGLVDGLAMTLGEVLEAEMLG